MTKKSSALGQMTPKVHELSKQKNGCTQKTFCKNIREMVGFDKSFESTWPELFFEDSLVLGRDLPKLNHHETEGERSHGFRPSMFLLDPEWFDLSGETRLVLKVCSKFASTDLPQSFAAEG